jgi:DNA invertase Pin-like site-specific DNA recombinase
VLIGYARVSVGSQDHALQLDALRAAAASGFSPKLAADRGLTGRNSPRHSTRSLRHLIALSDQLQQCAITLRSLTEAIDTGTPSGRFLFNILGALGQMEREIIVERTRAGLAAGRARGRMGGRPPVLDRIKVTAAKPMLASGNLTAAEVARQLGCAPSTLYRHLPGGRTAINETGT